MRQGSQYRLKCITQGSLFVQLLLACAAQPSCSAGGTATRRLPRPFRCVPHWAGSPAIAASPGSHQAGSLRWHTARASGSRALHSRKRHTGGGGAASGSASGAAGKHAARQAGARAAIARAGSQLDRTIVKQETASLSFSGQHCMRACGPPTRTVLLIQPLEQQGGIHVQVLDGCGGAAGAPGSTEACWTGGMGKVHIRGREHASQRPAPVRNQGRTMQLLQWSTSAQAGACRTAMHLQLERGRPGWVCSAAGPLQQEGSHRLPRRKRPVGQHPPTHSGGPAAPPQHPPAACPASHLQKAGSYTEQQSRAPNQHSHMPCHAHGALLSSPASFPSAPRLPAPTCWGRGLVQVLDQSKGAARLSETRGMGSCHACACYAAQQSKIGVQPRPPLPT